MMRRFIRLFQFFSVSCIWIPENMSETAMDAKSVNPFHTTKIVGSYLRHHTVGASQLPDLITSVHRALTEVRQPSLPEELLTPCRFSEAICASRFRGLSGMRIPGKNLTPPHQHPTWLQPG
jgi:hypothetical protein